LSALYKIPWRKRETGKLFYASVQETTELLPLIPTQRRNIISHGAMNKIDTATLNGELLSEDQYVQVCVVYYRAIRRDIESRSE